jgi:hypothetical protein
VGSVRSFLGGDPYGDVVDQNLGIFRLDPVAPFPSAGETVRRVKARAYCEQLTYAFRP